ncbi:ABC transporter substrate-binding protein [Reinekea sp. G2M2-21]|uniref:substrate-binding periplasmic protein n=1 Tax=Reinekea sp. G2M2-21 TaxID=2788942 RepID=UPI0018AB39BF|nr:transporter substrate-binding domain-containing protein [Reinekea sp. G2M2-21]
MKSVRSLAFLLVLPLLSGALQAEIKVAIDEEYVKLAPYIIDDLIEAYKLANIPASFTVLPGSRAIALANVGEYDALDARFKNTEPVKNMIAIDVPIYLQNAYYAWGMGKETNLDSEALKDMTISASRASAFAQDLASKGYTIVFVANEETALKMVLAGRVQAALYSDYIFNQQKAAGITGRAKAVSAPLYSEWLYHHVHKSHADLVPALEAAIRELKGQGLFGLR